ncbi:MAG TPA: DUF4112 domain-containing protein [Polyangia bacterium]
MARQDRLVPAPQSDPARARAGGVDLVDQRGAGPANDDPALAAATKIARVMDGWYVDPVLGLVAPWLGDVVGAGLGVYPVLLAWRRGAPKSLVARMLLNLSVDLVAGAVPIVGDVWDFFFRAHRRNLGLLQSRVVGREVVASKRDGWIVAGAVLAFITALAVPVGLLIWGASALFR